jgi:hypothetical protein
MDAGRLRARKGSPVAIHNLGPINLRGESTLEALAVVVTVTTGKELKGAFRQQPPPQRIVVKRWTLLWFYFVTLLYFGTVVINNAMERN